MTQVEKYLEEKSTEIGFAYLGDLQVYKGDYLFSVVIKNENDCIDLSGSIFEVDSIIYHRSIQQTIIFLKVDYSYMQFCVNRIELSKKQNL